MPGRRSGVAGSILGLPDSCAFIRPAMAYWWPLRFLGCLGQKRTAVAVYLAFTSTAVRNVTGIRLNPLLPPRGTIIRKAALIPDMQGICRHFSAVAVMPFRYFSQTGLRYGRLSARRLSFTIQQMTLPHSRGETRAQESPVGK